jgi:signal transduction histidine kinase
MRVRERGTRYWIAVVLAGFAVYTAIAILGTVSSLVYFRGAHTTIDLRSFVANRFLEQWTCAVFVAPLFWLVDRYPLSTMAWRRHAAVLLGAILSFVLVKYAVMLPLYRLWVGKWGDAYWLSVVENTVAVSFDFIAIVGVAHAVRYYAVVGERERAAADLQTQLVQARLDALRGQLHPHFLFNTLNAAATLMHEDVDAADEMLSELGELLRTSLERVEREITVADELELTRRYLAIMRYRFSDRLTVRYDVPDELRQAMVPPFIVQPLIENALEHGIGRRRGAGCIEISAQRHDGRLELAVSDDGPGLVAASTIGIGLSNTRARLAQLYGDAGGMTLESTARGVRAVVQIPFRECAES